MTRLGFEPRTYGLKVPFSGRHSATPSATARFHRLAHPPKPPPNSHPANRNTNTMTLKTACAIGILAGLTITAATTWKPKPKPITINKINNAWNHPYAFPVQNKPDDLPTIEVDGRTYRVSPYASPIPCWYVGGKAICINGTVSDINQ